MKWKDPDTIKVYEHYFNEAVFRDIHENMSKKMCEYEQEYLKKSHKTIKCNDDIKEILPTAEVEWINEFYKGMDN